MFEVLCKGDFASLPSFTCIFNHLFIWLWIYFTLWMIIQCYLIYVVAQVVLAIGNSFRLAPGFPFFFKGYPPFITTILYWLHSLICIIHPCNLLILISYPCSCVPLLCLLHFIFFFKYFLTFWNDKMLQVHLIPCHCSRTRHVSKEPWCIF